MLVRTVDALKSAALDCSRVIRLHHEAVGLEGQLDTATSLYREGKETN